MWITTTQNCQELCTTHNDPAVVNWTSSDAARAIGPTMLKAVNNRGVLYQVRRNGASLLETPDGRVNFCTPDRHCGAGGRHLIKVLADKPSLDAMASTLLNLAVSHNARFLHVRVEPEPIELGNQHRDQFTAMRKRSALKKAEEAASKAEEAAEDAATKSEEAEEEAATKAESPGVKLCVLCKKHGHVARACVMPNPTYGCITYCPICDTKDHGFDFCPKIKNTDFNSRTFVAEAAKLLLEGRINMPQIRSANWSFFDLLAHGCDLSQGVPRLAMVEQVRQGGCRRQAWRRFPKGQGSPVGVRPRAAHTR